MVSAEVEIRPEFHDLDPMQIVWHGNYMRYFEVARGRLLDKIDYNYPRMLESGFAWPVVEFRVKYSRPLKFGQRCRVIAKLVEYEYRLRIDYRILDAETGERLTKATSIQLPVEIATQELVFGCPPALIERVRQCR